MGLYAQEISDGVDGIVGGNDGADEEVKTMNEKQAMATGEVARLLGVPEPRIQDALRRHPKLAPPMDRGRRQWRHCDVEGVAAHFRVEITQGEVVTR